MPPHLYGELAKTKEGCDLLESVGHVPDFTQVLSNPSASPLEMRSALWTLGHIGASKTGFKFIGREVLTKIVELAEKSPCLSTRG